MGTYTKKWGHFLAKHQLIWNAKNGKIDMLGSFRLPRFFVALFLLHFTRLPFGFGHTFVRHSRFTWEKADVILIV